MAEYDERLQHRLNLQAMQIEQLLSQHGVQVEVRGGSVRDEGVRMDAREVMFSGKERLNAAMRQLTRVFGVDKVNLERSDGHLRFRYRRRPRNAIELLALMEMISEDVALSVPLGIDLAARPLMLRLDDIEGGNVLIAGGAESGKTSLLRAIVTATALKMRQSDVQLMVLGGSGRLSSGARYSLTPLEHFPHFTAPIMEGYDEAIEALNWMAEEAAYREANGIEWPLLLLVIDDLDSLLIPGEEDIVRVLGQLLDARPEAGIRVLISVSDALSPEIRRLLRHNVGLRLVGRLPGERDSRAATGMSGARAERLPGNGAFIAVAGGSAIRFQAAFIDDYDLRLAIDRTYGRSRGALLARPVHEASPSLPEEEMAGQDISFRVDELSGHVVLESPDEGSSEVSYEVSDREADAADEAVGRDDDAWYVGSDEAWFGEADEAPPL